MNIKTGDNIIMLSGKDRGKTGRILRFFPEEDKAVVEGLNLVKKHQRPKKQGQKGEVISAPRPVDISKIMLICQRCKKPSRMGVKREDRKIIRICKKCKGEN